MPETPKPQNNRIVTIVMLAVIGMTISAWLYIPFYRLVCQRLGIDVAEASLVVRDEATPSPNGTRTVLVQFMGVVNENLPVDFYPLERRLRVRPGETRKVMWRFTNLTDKSLEIQAVHNVSPVQADTLFHKIECFCFRQQTLDPKESREMPVTFRVDPRLPREIQSLTLGYTLYNLKPEQVDRLPSEKQALKRRHRGPSS